MGEGVDCQICGGWGAEKKLLIYVEDPREIGGA